MASKRFIKGKKEYKRIVAQVKAGKITKRAGTMKLYSNLAKYSGVITPVPQAKKVINKLIKGKYMTRKGRILKTPKGKKADKIFG